MFAEIHYRAGEESRAATAAVCGWMSGWVDGWMVDALRTKPYSTPWLQAGGLRSKPA